MENKQINSRIGLKNEGVLIREIVKQKSTSVVSRKRYVQFDLESLEEFQEKFRMLVGESILNESSSFEGRKWSGMSLHWNVGFDFSDFEYNKELYYALKCFVINELYDRRLSIKIVALRYSEIRKALKMTKQFNKSHLEEFASYIESKPATSLKDFKFGNTLFLYFYPINDCEEFLEELAYIPASKNMGEHVRELPPYKSIVWFDHLINNFMQGSSKELQKKYFPIYLWWRITTVIPLRPNEFLRLERDCCQHNSTNNQFYLKIPRTKQKANPLSKRRVIPQTNVLKTNADIYNLINEYKSLTNRDEDKYLFSLNSFDHLDKQFHNRRSNQESITKKDFDNLFKDFYTEIIEDKFNFEVYEPYEDLSDDALNFGIVRIKPGDTRHLAFCSMMLQGFNPLTIAEIGGHETLYSQNHYLGHLGEFTEAHTLMLTKFIKQNINKSLDDVNNLFTSKDKRELLFRNYSNKADREIDGGVCHSKNFPNDCIDKECLFCKYFQYDFSLPNLTELDDINNSLSSIKDEIETKIGFIKRYYAEMTKDRRNASDTFTINETTQSELDKESKLLKILINREAVLTAHLEKATEIEQGGKRN